MHGEIPVLKRCCFCLPLRYGLITWGYLKLVAGCFVILEMFYALYLTIQVRGMASGNDLRFNHSSSEIVAISITLIVFVTDFVLTTVLIVGGHKKNVKLLRVFYFYAIAVLVLTIFVIGVSTGLSIALTPRPLKFILLDSSAFCASIAIQTYFLLLLRSEIIKLRNNCEFRFVNNVKEAECTMKCDEEIADGETEIVDV